MAPSAILLDMIGDFSEKLPRLTLSNDTSGLTNAITLIGTQFLSEAGPFGQVGAGAITPNVANSSVDIGSGLFLSSTLPTLPAHVANKLYVDTLVQGMDWQQSVKSQSFASPPGPPVAGDRYIVAGPVPGGAWATFTVGDIVEYRAGAWHNLHPNLGFATYIEDVLLAFVWSGAAWVAFGGSACVWQRVGTDLSPAVAGDSVTADGGLTLPNGQVTSGVTDGAAAIAYKFDTKNALSTVGSKLTSFKNATVEKAFINKDGVYNGDVYGALRGRRTSATLAACIAVANELRTRMLAHAASSGGGAAHINADGVSFVGMPAAATSLATLKTLIAFELTSYAAHNADAELGAVWLYHAAQNAAPHTLASVVAPVTLALCVTRLADLKAKYNAHDADAASHTTASLFQSAVDLYGYSTVSSDYLITVEDTSSLVTITLSTADMQDGRMLTIKDTSGSAGINTIEVGTQGAEKIDGVDIIQIVANYGVLRVFSDGSNWFVG